MFHLGLNKCLEFTLFLVCFSLFPDFQFHALSVCLTFLTFLLLILSLVFHLFKY